MKRRIVLLSLLLAGCIFPATAQQRLEPAPGYFSELSENYMHSLRKTLIGDYLPILSIVVAPSFSEEYALSLYRDNQVDPAQYTLTYNIIDGDTSLWESGRFFEGNSNVTTSAATPFLTKSRSGYLSESDARLLNELVKASVQTMQMPDMDVGTVGFDGTTYYISYDYYTGTCWSPAAATNCGRLVEIAEQLINYLRPEKREFPDTLRQEIVKLTREFKSLRTPDNFALLKNVEKSWQTGDDDSQTILNLNLPNLWVSTNIPPSTPTTEALGLLSDYEPALREIARRIYMLDEIPLVITQVEVIADSKPESAEIRKDDDRNLPVIEIKLLKEHLSADTFMRLHGHLATADLTRDAYKLDSNKLRALLNNSGSQATKTNH